MVVFDWCWGYTQSNGTDRQTDKRLDLKRKQENLDTVWVVFFIGGVKSAFRVIRYDLPEETIFS